MRFEQLKRHLSDMSEDEQEEWFIQMSERRRLDGLRKLESSAKKPRRASNGEPKGRDKKITVTTEQLQLLKSLGLI